MPRGESIPAIFKGIVKIALIEFKNGFVARNRTIRFGHSGLPSAGVPHLFSTVDQEKHSMPIPGYQETSHLFAFRGVELHEARTSH